MVGVSGAGVTARAWNKLDSFIGLRPGCPQTLTLWGFWFKCLVLTFEVYLNLVSLGGSCFSCVS